MKYLGWDKIPGMYVYDDAALLMSAANYVRLPLHYPIVEIGVYYGRSLMCIAEATARKIYAIDKFEKFSEPGKEFDAGPAYQFVLNVIKAAGMEDRITVLRKSSFEVEWDGQPIAFLHIDGNHEYEWVHNDFEYFSQFVPKKGLVAFHDAHCYVYRGVDRVINEALDSGNWITWNRSRRLAVLVRI